MSNLRGGLIDSTDQSNHDNGIMNHKNCHRLNYGQAAHLLECAQPMLSYRYVGKFIAPIVLYNNELAVISNPQNDEQSLAEKFLATVRMIHQLEHDIQKKYINPYSYFSSLSLDHSNPVTSAELKSIKRLTKSYDKSCKYMKELSIDPTTLIEVKIQEPSFKQTLDTLITSPMNAWQQVISSQKLWYKLRYTQ